MSATLKTYLYDPHDRVVKIMKKFNGRRVSYYPLSIATCTVGLFSYIPVQNGLSDVGLCFAALLIIAGIVFGFLRNENTGDSLRKTPLIFAVSTLLLVSGIYCLATYKSAGFYVGDIYFDVPTGEVWGVWYVSVLYILMALSLDSFFYGFMKFASLKLERRER